MPHSAQSGLSAVQSEPLKISPKLRPDLRTLVHDLAQIVDMDPKRTTAKKHNELMRLSGPCEQIRSSDRPSTSNHRSFQDTSRRNDPHGNKARLNEVDVLDSPIGFLQDLALPQGNRLEKLT